MVAARSAAMGFNRLVDRADRRAESADGESRASARRDERCARRRRSSRSRRRVFVFAAWRLNPLCFVLSPVALAIVFWYSLAKRFTTWTQLFLGLAMAVAPVGGWLAVGGRGGWEPWLLALAIGTWVGGFDVLYACQDLEFDRAHGLRSIPVRFGVPASLAISRADARGDDRRACWRWRGSRRSSALYLAGVGVVAALLVYEQSLVARRRSVAGEARVRSERLRRHPLPARAGRVASMAAEHARRRRSRSRSPARAARCTRRGPLAALLARGVHVELVVSDYGRRLLRDELGERGDGRAAAAVPRRQVRRRRRAPGPITLHSNRDLGATIASGSHGCRGMAIVPCSMKTLAGVAHGLSRNLVERAADVMLKEQRPPRHRAARDADEPAAAEEHGALRRSRRDDPAGDAGVLSAAEDARRSRRLHGRQDPVRARLRARSLSGVDRPGRIVVVTHDGHDEHEGTND